MSQCVFEFTGRKDGERFVHRCTKCGQEVHGKYQERAPKANCTEESTGHPAALSSQLPPSGPGTEFFALTQQAGFKSGCGQCAALLAEMNQLGVDGCLREKPALMVKLNENTKQFSWLEKLAAGVKLIAEPWFNPLDPLGSMFDEAVSRAAAKLLINPVRNLVYHVGPFAGNAVWRWNVAEILKRIDLFNGRRAVAIIAGDGMDPPDEVKRAFAGHVENFAVFPNEPKFREVVSRPWLFDQIASTAQNEITFTAHAKGVTKPDHANVRRWTEIMYKTCLDYMPLAERLLQHYPIVGSFKRAGKFFINSPWHYSGTFYWLRNSRVFALPDWRRVEQRWWGTESWPGLHFPAQDGGVLFYEDKDADLYEDETMKKVEPAYVTWKGWHEKDRTAH